MIKNKSPGEIARGLEQFLNRKSGNLTIRENILLEDTIELLKKLNNPKINLNKRLINKSVIRLIINLLKFFTDEDFVDFFKKLS